MTSTLDINLTDEEFWARPQDERYAAFAQLRAHDPFAFFEEPELDFLPKGPGSHAVTRHADGEFVSSPPELFCSGQGAVSIVDMPPELLEFYGSLISMDDPRHATIRRIVSLAFTPKRLEEIVESV